MRNKGRVRKLYVYRWVIVCDTMAIEVCLSFYVPNGTRLSARCHFTGPKKLSISRAQPPPTCPPKHHARGCITQSCINSYNLPSAFKKCIFDPPCTPRLIDNFYVYLEIRNELFGALPHFKLVRGEMDT
jgi:hypothetical protein